MITKNHFVALTFSLILLMSLVSSSIPLPTQTSGQITLANGFDLFVTGKGVSSSNPVTGNNGTFHNVTVKINNTNNSNVRVNWSSADSVLTLPASGIISQGETEFTVGITLPNSGSFKVLTANFYDANDPSIELGEETANIYFSSTTPNPEPEVGFCEFGEVGTLEITDIEIDNLGEGDDEEWEPLDELEITVSVENKDKDDDVDDVIVEVKIENSAGEDVTDDFDFDDEENDDIGDLKDDDEEEVIFVIEEVPADLDEGNYKLYVKAYSDKDGEEVHCADEYSNDKYQDFEFTRDDDEAVVVRDSDLTPAIQTTCGQENVEVSFPVYNIGEDKEESVLINIFNRDLDINEIETLSNLRSGKSKEVTFFVDIPEGLKKEKYDLEIVTYFDYDDDDGDEEEIFAYDQNSDDDLDRSFFQRIDVLSCSAAKPVIKAELKSSQELNQPLIISVPITNNAEEKSFTVSAEGYTEWAELESITPQRLTLEKGETGQVTVTLIPTKTGVQTFNILTVAGSESFKQAVTVKIEGDEDKSPIDYFEGNTLAYLIIGIVALLILILITVIVRMSRRRPRKTEF